MSETQYGVWTLFVNDPDVYNAYVNIIACYSDARMHPRFLEALKVNPNDPTAKDDRFMPIIQNFSKYSVSLKDFTKDLNLSENLQESIRQLKQQMLEIVKGNCQVRWLEPEPEPEPESKIKQKTRLMSRFINPTTSSQIANNKYSSQK